uniref:Uncharacterized protein n=1 Tax=Acrobeloides nanus TaxID=290746 RepID=A0A914EGI9_9BILA
MPDLNPSNIKFCGNYERLCDGDTEAEVARYQPPITTTMAPTTRIANIPIVISEHGALGVLNNPAQKVLLTQDIIKTCTPDCTAPQCSKECKCANTHIAVESKCNPPPSSDMVGVCQAWYAECPMFKQLQYGEHS